MKRVSAFAVTMAIFEVLNEPELKKKVAKIVMDNDNSAVLGEMTDVLRDLYDLIRTASVSHPGMMVADLTTSTIPDSAALMIRIRDFLAKVEG